MVYHSYKHNFMLISCSVYVSYPRCAVKMKTELWAQVFYATNFRTSLFTAALLHLVANLSYWYSTWMKGGSLCVADMSAFFRLLWIWVKFFWLLGAAMRMVRMDCLTQKVLCLCSSLCLCCRHFTVISCSCQNYCAAGRHERFHKCQWCLQAV